MDQGKSWCTSHILQSGLNNLHTEPVLSNFSIFLFSVNKSGTLFQSNIWRTLRKLAIKLSQFWYCHEMLHVNQLPFVNFRSVFSCFAWSYAYIAFSSIVFLCWKLNHNVAHFCMCEKWTITLTSPKCYVSLSIHFDQS